MNSSPSRGSGMRLARKVWSAIKMKKAIDDGTLLYLHVFDWPCDRELPVPGLQNRVEKAYVLADGTALQTREQHIPIIDALVNGNEGQFQVNVPNRGALEGIPDDVVVEVPALIDQKGIQPLRVGALPPKIMLECVLPEWLKMERDLLAFKTGDRSMMFWNVLDSHQTRSYDQAQAVLDDLLAMAGHEELADHYKFPPGYNLA